MKNKDESQERLEAFAKASEVISSIFPDGYFEKARESLKNYIEEEANFKRWTGEPSYFRYVLVPHLRKYDTRVYSNSIEDLECLFEENQKVNDSTTQHFIADLKEKKVVKFLQNCL